MNVTAIRTKKFIPPKDDLNDLFGFIPRLSEKSIVAISSKVLSICEGQTKLIASIPHELLVNKLSTAVLEPVKRSKNGMVLTQVGNLLVESAGIDMSNGNGYYILLPKNPYASAKKIWKFLKKRDGVKLLGVVITDSHSVPRRLGAEGFALASYGFKATHIYKHEADIFGRKFHFTASDVADSLAATAVLSMGEGNENTPVAIFSGLDNIDYFKKALPLSTARHYSWVNPDLDVYSPLLKSDLWRKNK